MKITMTSTGERNVHLGQPCSVWNARDEEDLEIPFIVLVLDIAIPANLVKGELDIATRAANVMERFLRATGRIA